MCEGQRSGSFAHLLHGARDARRCAGLRDACALEAVDQAALAHVGLPDHACSMHPSDPVSALPLSCGPHACQTHVSEMHPGLEPTRLHTCRGSA